jgi:hypothetical protein
MARGRGHRAPVPQHCHPPVVHRGAGVHKAKAALAAAAVVVAGHHVVQPVPHQVVLVVAVWHLRGEGACVCVQGGSLGGAGAARRLGALGIPPLWARAEGGGRSAVACLTLPQGAADCQGQGTSPVRRLTCSWPQPGPCTWPSGRCTSRHCCESCSGSWQGASCPLSVRLQKSCAGASGGWPVRAAARRDAGRRAKSGLHSLPHLAVDSQVADVIVVLQQSVSAAVRAAALIRRAAQHDDAQGAHARRCTTMPSALMPWPTAALHHGLLPPAQLPCRSAIGRSQLQGDGGRASHADLDVRWRYESGCERGRRQEGMAHGSA